MKKWFIIVALTIGCVSAKAQGYCPMLDSLSNTWYYTGNIIPVRMESQAATNCDYNSWSGFEANSFFTDGDTVIGVSNYKKIIYTAFNWPGFDCDYGYIREDTASRKIYFMDNVFLPEILLYDFSMTTGDSIYISFLQPFGIYQTGYYHLDSIRNIQIPAGIRRIFYLNNHLSPSFFPIEWVESVGHTGHLVYTLSANMNGGLFSSNCIDGISRYFYQILTCFEHNAQKIYFDSCSHSLAVNNGCFFYEDSCNYFNICGSLEETSPISNAIIAPNPFTVDTELLINVSHSSTMNINVYNMEGRLINILDPVFVIPGKNKITLPLKNLSTGFYLIEIRNQDQKLYLKISKT